MIDAKQRHFGLLTVISEGNLLLITVIAAEDQWLHSNNNRQP